jgi:hypothetical protein
MKRQESFVKRFKRQVKMLEKISGFPTKRTQTEPAFKSSGPEISTILKHRPYNQNMHRLEFPTNFFKKGRKRL